MREIPFLRSSSLWTLRNCAAFPRHWPMPLTNWIASTKRPEAPEIPDPRSFVAAPPPVEKFAGIPTSGWNEIPASAL
jgi:hypothetical protein